MMLYLYLSFFTLHHVVSLCQGILIHLIFCKDKLVFYFMDVLQCIYLGSSYYFNSTIDTS